MKQQERAVRKSMWRWVLAAVAGLTLTIAVPASAGAATLLPTDAAVTPGAFTQFGNGALGPYGDQAQMTYFIHNYGPNDLPPTHWSLEVIAPPGTELNPNTYAYCQQIEAKRDYVCLNSSQVFVDDPANLEGVCCNPGTVKLTIVGPVTGPGKVKVIYDGDTNTGNNVATIPASAHPVSTGTAAPTTKAPTTGAPAAGTPTKAPTAGAATTARAGQPATTPDPASPSAPAVTDPPSASISDAASSSDTGSPRTPSDSPLALDLVGTRGGSGSALPWIIAVVVLAGAGVGTAFLIRRRRQSA